VPYIIVIFVVSCDFAYWFKRSSSLTLLYGPAFLMTDPMPPGFTNKNTVPYHSIFMSHKAENIVGVPAASY
jgi:hypothetical protein